MIQFLKKIIGDKKEYRAMMTRVKALPQEYGFVFEKMQGYMWGFATGSGYDMLQVQYDLIELFEEGVVNGKSVLEITGEDVASFCDELLRSAKTYPADCHAALNRAIMKKLGE